MLLRKSVCTVNLLSTVPINSDSVSTASSVCQRTGAGSSAFVILVAVCAGLVVLALASAIVLLVGLRKGRGVPNLHHAYVNPTYRDF